MIVPGPALKLKHSSRSTTYAPAKP